MIELKNDFEKRIVDIYGGRGKVGEVEKALETIRKADDSHGTISQLFNARVIASQEHLLHASKMALKSLESGGYFANSPEIELTCWVAGRRQINKAIERVGIKSGTEEIAAVTIGENEKEIVKTQNEIFEELGLEEDEKVLNVTGEEIEDIRNAFSLSKEQLEVSEPEELVLEKIALLRLEK